MEMVASAACLQDLAVALVAADHVVQPMLIADAVLLLLLQLLTAVAVHPLVVVDAMADFFPAYVAALVADV